MQQNTDNDGWFSFWRNLFIEDTADVDSFSSFFSKFKKSKDNNTAAIILPICVIIGILYIISTHLKNDENIKTNDYCEEKVLEKIAIETEQKYKKRVKDLFKNLDFT